MPVSVCHHVSMTGVRSPPMCSRYHIHASGLIGSPTVPSSRRDERSWCRADCSPLFISASGGAGGGGGVGGVGEAPPPPPRAPPPRGVFFSGKSGVPSYSTP